jgi:xanthine dehydrogenase small subunit
MPPLLIAAGATLVLRRGGETRRMPLEDYFLGYGRQDRRPGEFVESVVIPRPPASRQFRAYKISKRFDQDISALCAAFAIDVQDGVVAAARIAFGGMAATPKRAARCEAALVGEPWTWASVDAAAGALAEDFTPITDLRASAEYRLRCAGNLLRKCWIQSAEPATATRVLEATDG